MLPKMKRKILKIEGKLSRSRFKTPMSFFRGELEKNSVIRKYRTTANDGKKYNTNYYNLDAILSVGYRVNSSQATQFRIWASKILKDYIIKGFAMDDERLKHGHYFGKDYFKELLERVRSIRTSERRIYQQITDVFAECSIDYDAKSDLSKHFYAMVQNKFHFAITGQTASEIVYSKADKKNALPVWKFLLMFLFCWAWGWICPDRDESFSLKKSFRVVEDKKANGYLTDAGKSLNNNVI